MKEIIALDIDGVIADFFGPFLRFFNARKGTDLRYAEARCHDLGKCFDVPLDQMLEVLKEFNGRFSERNVLPIIGAKESLDKLKDRYDFVVVTSRQPYLEQYTRDWLAENFPIKEIHFSLGRNNPYSYGNNLVFKPKLAEQAGAFCLVEDNEQEFEHWDSDIVQPICYAQPWNTSVAKSNPDVVRGEWPALTEYFLAR